MPHRQAQPSAGGVVQAETGTAIRKHLLDSENGAAGGAVGVKPPAVVT
jgi:hypothetical protein